MIEYPDGIPAASPNVSPAPPQPTETPFISHGPALFAAVAVEATDASNSEGATRSGNTESVSTAADTGPEATVFYVPGETGASEDGVAASNSAANDSDSQSEEASYIDAVDAALVDLDI